MMLKQILFILLILPLSAFDATQDSTVSSTATLSGDALIKENFEKTKVLDINYTKIKPMAIKYQACEAKNMLYMGEETVGTDSDGCLDIQQATLKRSSKKPTWAGFYSGSGTRLRYGTLSSTLTYYSTNYTDYSIDWGRSRADVMCKSAIPNSRAMTVDDLKYVYNDIPLSGDHFNTADNSKYMWIFDGHESIDENGNPIAKYGFDKDATTCSGWRSTTGTGLVLEVGGSVTNYYMQQNTRSCADTALIGCVTN